MGYNFDMERKYLINTLQIRAQPAMHTKHTTVNDRAQSQVIKYFAAPPPHVRAAIFSLTLIIKPIHLRYLT